MGTLLLNSAASFDTPFCIMNSMFKWMLQIHVTHTILNDWYHQFVTDNIYKKKKRKNDKKPKYNREYSSVSSFIFSFSPGQKSIKMRNWLLNLFSIAAVRENKNTKKNLPSSVAYSLIRVITTENFHEFPIVDESLESKFSKIPYLGSYGPISWLNSIK